MVTLFSKVVLRCALVSKNFHEQVIFKIMFSVDPLVKDLSRLPTIIKAMNGEGGRSKSCHGKSACHKMIKVPVGTVFKEPYTAKVTCFFFFPSFIFLT